MWKTLRWAMIVMGLGALVACDESLDELAPEELQAAGGKEDGFTPCGGEANLTCPEGYHCVVESQEADAPGVCVGDDEPAPEANVTEWACVEQVRPHYYNTECISADVVWNRDTGACSFQVYLSDKDRDSLDCDPTTRSLWIDTIDCVKWTTVTYDVVSSHLFYEDGTENPYASVMIRTTGGVTASGNEFGPLFSYMEDPDYLGANFSRDLVCEALAD